MKNKEIYAQTKPLGGIHGNSRPISAFHYTRKLTEKEIVTIAGLYRIYHFADRITEDGKVLIGHANFDSVEYTIDIDVINKYMKENGIIK